MGLDAVLWIKTKKLSKQELVDLNYDTAEAFGSDKFYFSRENNRHIIEKAEKGYYELPDEVKKGEQIYDVNIWTRYWGDGYERGDFPFIYALSKFLEKKVNAKTYYGSDCGETLELLDEKEREEMFEHFIKVGNKPYRGSSFSVDNEFSRECDFCKKPMVRYGFGGGGLYAGFSCHGCDFKEETRDGGKTWQEIKK